MHKKRETPTMIIMSLFFSKNDGAPVTLSFLFGSTFSCGHLGDSLFSASLQSMGQSGLSLFAGSVQFTVIFLSGTGIGAGFGSGLGAGGGGGGGGFGST